MPQYSVSHKLIWRHSYPLLVMIMIRLILTAVFILIFSGCATGVDLIYTLDYHPDMENPDDYKSIFAVTLGAKAEVNLIYTMPDEIAEREVGFTRYTRGSPPGAIACGPDGKIYFVTAEIILEYRGDGSGPESLRFADKYETLFIKKFSPDITDPNPALDTVYTFPEVIPIYGLYVRNAGGNDKRIYYSTGAAGALGTGQIYYIGEDGVPVLYFTLNPEDIGVATCGGEEVGYWSGDFTFDDSNDRLYLSSGNHNPSAIFMVTGAGLDAISNTSTITRIYDFNRSAGAMDFPPGNLLYFTDVRNHVHRLDLNEDPASLEGDAVVYESHPEDRISGIAVIREHAESPHPSGNFRMRLPAQSSGMLNRSESGVIRDVSVYEPIPELWRAGPKLPKGYKS